MKETWDDELLVKINNNNNNNNDSKIVKIYKIVKNFWFWAYISVFCNTFYFFPFYLLSRSVNILLPVIVMCYLAITGYWDQIDLFQYVMLGIYVSLTGIWSIFAWFALNRSFWIFHLSLDTGFGVRKWSGSVSMSLQWNIICSKETRNCDWSTWTFLSNWDNWNGQDVKKRNNIYKFCYCNINQHFCGFRVVIFLKSCTWNCFCLSSHNWVPV